MTAPLRLLPDKPRVVFAERQVSRAARGGLGHAKTSANYAHQYYPSWRAKEAGCDAVLWLDAENHTRIEEASTACLPQRELPPLGSIGVWPPVQTGAELADLSARLGWYVPDTCSIDIPAVDRVMRTRLPFVSSSRTRNTPLIRCTVGTS